MSYTREQIEDVAYSLGGKFEEMFLQLLTENDALQAEMQEQCRIIGMSAEREMSLRSKLDSLREDAERWKKAHNLISAENQLGHARFVFNMLEAPMNVMRGSVAEHFTKSIDAARKKGN